MLSTSEEIFQAFLVGIRKQSTAVVYPENFVILWNVYAMMEWVAENSSLREGVELTQKQMDDLRMIRKQVYIDPVSTNLFNLPDGSTNPKYKRALNIMFQLSTGGDYVESDPMRADREGPIRKSYYRKPQDDRLYYQLVENQVKMITSSDGSSALKMYLDYYRYPNEMSYADSAFSYDIDLPEEQLKEVIDKAILIYLKKAKDPLFQAELQGQMIEKPDKI